MKKLLVLLFGSVLAVSMSMPVFAQDTGGDKAKTEETGKKATKTKASKAHKGGKKSKKGSGETTTPPPK